MSLQMICGTKPNLVIMISANAHAFAIHEQWFAWLQFSAPRCGYHDPNFDFPHVTVLDVQGVALH